MERHSDTIKEIDLRIGYNTADGGRADRALRSCTRVEILTHPDAFAVDTWLGLSQLHTLREVNLKAVTFAAIAAAFPRLHTLDVFTDPGCVPASAAGFFDDLLPRLRSFHFTGCWPRESEFQPATAARWRLELPLLLLTATASLRQELLLRSEAATAISSPQELPLLRELVLHFFTAIDLPVARGFSGAQPVLLRLSYAALITGDLLTDAENRAGGGILARVRDLTLVGAIRDGPPGLARVLRAAPQLRAFTAIRMDGDFLFAPNPEGFAGLVHPRLRSIDIRRMLAWDSVPTDGIARLRQQYFPRLRRLTVGGQPPDVYQ
jgi:hypothetical protein